MSLRVGSGSHEQVLSDAGAFSNSAGQRSVGRSADFPYLSNTSLLGPPVRADESHPVGGAPYLCSL